MSYSKNEKQNILSLNLQRSLSKYTNTMIYLQENIVRSVRSYRLPLSY